MKIGAGGFRQPSRLLSIEIRDRQEFHGGVRRREPRPE
jgi:hypothetical protein